MIRWIVTVVSLTLLVGACGVFWINEAEIDRPTMIVLPLYREEKKKIGQMWGRVREDKLIISGLC